MAPMLAAGDRTPVRVVLGRRWDQAAGSCPGSRASNVAPGPGPCRTRSAAHPAGELAADGQAEAEAPAVAVLEALEHALGVRRRDAGPVVAHRDAHGRAGGHRDARPPRRAGAWRSALSSRIRTIRATAPGSAAAHAASGAASVDAGPSRPAELRDDRPRQRRRARPAPPQLDAGVEPAEVEQLAGQLAEPVGLAAARAGPGRGRRRGPAARRAGPPRRRRASAAATPAACAARARRWPRTCAAPAPARRRRRCIVAKARARSPISSRRRRRRTGAAPGPSSATRRAMSRSAVRRRASRDASATPADQGGAERDERRRQQRRAGRRPGRR